MLLALPRWVDDAVYPLTGVSCLGCPQLNLARRYLFKTAAAVAVQNRADVAPVHWDADVPILSDVAFPTPLSSTRLHPYETADSSPTHNRPYKASTLVA